MLKSTLLTLLTTASAAYAQFPLKITSPSAFLQLGGTFPVFLTSNVTAGTAGPNIQISLCTEITGLPPCNNTLGSVLLNAPFNPPSETYNITIPADQTPGVTRILAGHYHLVAGVPSLTDETFAVVNLGSRV